MKIACWFPGTMAGQQPRRNQHWTYRTCFHPVCC